VVVAGAINKATGWFTVALGAALLAAEQTWQVIGRYHCPAWLFWLLIIVILGTSVLNTALWMSHDGRTDQPAVSPSRPELAGYHSLDLCRATRLTRRRVLR
jgi:hypothetical protein